MQIHDDLVASLRVLAKNNGGDMLLDHCGYKLLYVIMQFLSGVSLREANDNSALCLQLNKYAFDLLVAGTDDNQDLSRKGLRETIGNLADTLANVEVNNLVIRLDNKLLTALNSALND